MEYRWDIRDRLTGITVKNDLGEIIRTAEYTYDVYNQRIAKTVDTDGDGSLAAVTERFVYGSDQNIALVFDENGNVNHRYLFGNGVDQIEADENDGNTRWALTDHLGSVRDVVDDSGTVLNHVVYDAFGSVTSQTDESVVFRYGYTAREIDSESGLQYNRARYFDPAVGRFISEDPIGFRAGDANLYRYAFNQPITKTDPSGFESRELTALFKSSIESPNSKIVLLYNTVFPKFSVAYAYAAAWFDQITTGSLSYPKSPPSEGSLVFRDLKDDTGRFTPSIAGKANLRSFSSNKVGGIKGVSTPTIDLKVDRFSRSHSTPDYMHIEEVKFNYEDKNKAPQECTYIPQNQFDEDERQKARIAVANIISSYPTTSKVSSPQFTFPDVDFGGFFKSVLEIPGAALREFIRN
ncbi:RHS repeat-associated core domain-containing protein [Pseudanabaena catenata USMAC16]|nr:MULTISPECIES: RHS repeat-associated core domain-containing protein [Pseudanabaena]MDG3496283.1 RHS repeat-associated core domain-containing protein [Pseudanabaena catenata USMAC16]